MLAAIITLALLSLLVATEADPASPRTDHAPDEPLRPNRKLGDRQKTVKPGRLAA